MGRLTFKYTENQEGHYVLTVTNVKTGTEQDTIEVSISSGNETKNGQFELAHDADAGKTVAEAIFEDGLGGTIGNDGDNTKDLDFGDFSVNLDGASIIFMPKDATNSSEPVIKIGGVEIKLSK